MRNARRLIATLIGVAFWSVVATTVAYAQRLPDPPVGQAPKVSISGGGTSNWKYVLIAVLAALLAVAVVGLVASLRHSRESRPSSALHA